MSRRATESTPQKRPLVWAYMMEEGSIRGSTPTDSLLSGFPFVMHVSVFVNNCKQTNITLVRTRTRAWRLSGTAPLISRAVRCSRTRKGYQHVTNAHGQPQSAWKRARSSVGCDGRNTLCACRGMATGLGGTNIHEASQSCSNITDGCLNLSTSTPC